MIKATFFLKSIILLLKIKLFLKIDIPQLKLKKMNKIKYVIQIKFIIMISMNKKDKVTNILMKIGVHLIIFKKNKNMTINKLKLILKIV
jgi:hypothetical protein